MERHQRTYIVVVQCYLCVHMYTSRTISYQRLVLCTPYIVQVYIFCSVHIIYYILLCTYYNYMTYRLVYTQVSYFVLVWLAEERPVTRLDRYNSLPQAVLLTKSGPYFLLCEQEPGKNASTPAHATMELPQLVDPKMESSFPAELMAQFRTLLVTREKHTAGLVNWAWGLQKAETEAKAAGSRRRGKNDESSQSPHLFTVEELQQLRQTGEFGVRATHTRKDFALFIPPAHLWLKDSRRHYSIVVSLARALAF